MTLRLLSRQLQQGEISAQALAEQALDDVVVLRGSRRRRRQASGEVREQIERAFRTVESFAEHRRQDPVRHVAPRGISSTSAIAVPGIAAGLISPSGRRGSLPSVVNQIVPWPPFGLVNSVRMATRTAQRSCSAIC